MLHGVIDLGKNMVRLSIYRFRNEQLSMCFSQKVILELEDYMCKNHIMSELGIKKLIDVVLNMKEIARKKESSTLSIIATTVIQNSSNAIEVAQKIEQATKLPVKWFRGQNEALTGFTGMQFSGGVYVDIGKERTEIAIYQDNQMLQTFSIPIGSLNMYLKM